MNLSFTDARARRADSQTSRDAARNAAGTKAQGERIAIRQALEQFKPGLTAREIAAHTRIDYIEVQRRLSEVAGIEKSNERRDGCMVWRALFFAPTQPKAVTPGTSNKHSVCE